MTSDAVFDDLKCKKNIWTNIKFYILTESSPLYGYVARALFNPASSHQRTRTAPSPVWRNRSHWHLIKPDGR